MGVIDSVINWCIQIADNDQYQYSQDGNKRWGEHSRNEPPFYYDCSSFVSDAFRRFNDVGFDFTAGFTAYTGTMYGIFTTNNYFIDVTSAGVIKRGDVLLTHIEDGRQHTCIYMGTVDVPNVAGVNKKCVEAINTAYGIRENYDDQNAYQYILRYVGRVPVWHGKTTGGYLKESDEAIDNARMIYNYLSTQGFSLEAVSGMLGSMEVESGYNPFRWETRSDEPTVLSINDIYYMSTTRHGYGLAQFTPSIDYFNIGGNSVMNFSDRPGNVDGDGNLQLDVIANDRLHKWSQSAQRHIPAEFNMSMSEFKVCTNLYNCSGAWLYCYEYPGQVASQVETRYNYAQYWYNVLSGYSPTPPTPPMPTIKRNKWKVWLYKKNTERSKLHL